jgi:hypothetical protein
VRLIRDLGEDAATYHCGDDEFLSSVYLWKTPLPDCGDDAARARLLRLDQRLDEIRGAG